MKKKLKLDLACGLRKREGYKGVDIVPGPDVDYVFDLEVHPWPLEDDIATDVYCSHYVEHCRDLIGFMNDLWRVCKDEAMVEIYHPYWSSLDAWQDPTHVRALNEVSWNYYNQAWLNDIGMGHYPIVADFEVVNLNYTLMDQKFMDMSEEDRMWHIAHSNNVVRQLGVTLRARK